MEVGRDGMAISRHHKLKKKLLRYQSRMDGKLKGEKKKVYQAMMGEDIIEKIRKTVIKQSEQISCSICKKTICKRLSNSCYPMGNENDRCCGICNDTYIIPLRFSISVVNQYK
jgi:ribosomal protein L37AE/L43A